MSAQPAGWWARCRAGLRARWLAWRNRRLADPAFQRAAARWWPTRGVARRDTRRLFDLCAGFVYSQVLSACIALDLFGHLRARPLGVAELAPRLDLDEAGCERLLEAAASLGLVERLADGRYALGRLGAAAQGNTAVGAMVGHHRALYVDLADPVARLRDRQAPSALRDFWTYAGPTETRSEPAGPDDTAAYTRLMADSQAMIAEQVVASCHLDDLATLLDVGGGSGVFAEIVARAAPQLSISVADLPAVAEQARTRLATSDVAARIACRGLDMFADPWPDGFDAITLVRVLHDHEDAAVEQLLRHAWAALRPGGRLIIAEPMADTPGAAPIGAAYFGFYLWTMGQGKPRSAAALRQLCERQGFVDICLPATPNPLLARVLLAYRTTATDGH